VGGEFGIAHHRPFEVVRIAAGPRIPSSDQPTEQSHRCIVFQKVSFTSDPPNSNNFQKTTSCNITEKMSATTTDNPITLTIQRTLADYDLHISGETGPNSSQSPIEPPNAIHNTPQVSNPHNWPRDYHRVPNYRPINRNLDMVQRPNGSSGPETAFITVMFTGIAINAVSSPPRVYL